MATSGEPARPSDLDANNDAAIEDAFNWTSYTPTTSNLTVGSGGTTTGRYVQRGKTVHFEILIILGTGPTVGAVNVSVPVAMGTAAASGIFQAKFNDSGTAAFQGLAVPSSTTVLSLRYTSSQAGQLGVISSTLPFTWAATDVIFIAGTYEAA